MLRTFRGGLLIGLAVAVAVAAIAIIYERYDTRTLKRTVNRGEVLCGVNKGLPGFSIPDDKGDWTGFDVDFCRAVAAAIFLRSPIMTARASCCRARARSIRRWISTTARSACRRGQQPCSILRIISA